MISEKIQNLPSDILRATNNKIAVHQRKVDAIFIEHLAETIKRKAFMDWGFSSIYEYLTSELKFSGSSANRRIQAAYALIHVPEIKQDLENGSLSLSQVCSVQTAIRQEQKVNGPIPTEEKRELFAEIRNTSARETEKIIDRKFETASQPLPIEKHKHDDSVVLTVRFNKEEYELLTRAKELNSHTIRDGNWKDMIVLLAKREIQKRDPQAQKPVKMKAETQLNISQRGTDTAETPRKSGSRSPDSTSSSDSDSSVHTTSHPITRAISRPAFHAKSSSNRSIRPSVRRYIFQRDRVCQFKHSDGRVCGSRHQLELDHVEPVYAGGSHEIENLRVICRAHNQYRYTHGR